MAAQPCGRVVGERAGHLGQDARTGVDQDPPLGHVAERRVVVDGVLDELPQLGQRLDARVAGTDEDEDEVAARVARVGLGEVELAEHVVAQADGVAEVLERHRVLGQPRDRQHPGDRTQGDHEAPVGHLDVPELGLDRDRPRGLVQRRDPAAELLGVRAHHPQRHVGVPRLERAGGDLGQQRREEHRALGADDRGLAEQPRHVRAAEPAADDQRAAPRREHHGRRTRHVAPARAMTRSSASTTRPEVTIVVRPWWTTSPVHESGPPLSSGGTQEPHVELAGDVADRGRQERVHRAAHRGVQQCREHAAVDDAERVEVPLAQVEGERDPAGLGLDRLDAERPHGRRQREGPGADGVQHGEAVLGDAGEPGGLLVLPAVGAMPRVELRVGRHGFLLWWTRRGAALMTAVPLAAAPADAGRSAGQVPAPEAR